MNNYDKAKESEENEESESDSNVSEYDASSQGKDTVTPSESSVKIIKKQPQKKVVQSKVLPKKLKLNTPVKKKEPEPEESEELDEEEVEEEEEEEEEENSEEEVGEAIEEPVQVVRGEGNGKACKSPNPLLEPEFGECIEETVMYFYGEGSGRENLVGNTGKEEPKESSSNKQLFFFGKPGCLNNSPVKSPTQSSMFSLSMPSGNPKPTMSALDTSVKFSKMALVPNLDIDSILLFSKEIFSTKSFNS